MIPPVSTPNPGVPEKRPTTARTLGKKEGNEMSYEGNMTVQNENCEGRKPSRLAYYKAVVDAIPADGIVFRDDFDMLLEYVAIDMKVDKPGSSGAAEILDLMDMIVIKRRSESKDRSSRFIDGDVIYRKIPQQTLTIKPHQVGDLLAACRDADYFVRLHVVDAMMFCGSYKLQCSKTSVTITLGE